MYKCNNELITLHVFEFHVVHVMSWRTSILYQESRDAVLQKEQIEEEMRELSDTVEIATLDKEMAEEKVLNRLSPY